MSIQNLDIYTKYWFMEGECPENDYIINGQQLQNLYDICFKYSTKFSLCFHDDILEEYSQFDKWAINSINSLDWKINAGIAPPSFKYRELGVQYDKFLTLKVYECCDETRKLLDLLPDNLLQDDISEILPEDLIFYREDGTVFFYSVTHEGECSFFVKEGEDISPAIDERWFKASTTKHMPRPYLEEYFK